MKTSRGGRRYSWRAWREALREGGLSALPPISVGASESPFVASADHECCRAQAPAAVCRQRLSCGEQGWDTHCSPLHIPRPPDTAGAGTQLAHSPSRLLRNPHANWGPLGQLLPSPPAANCSFNCVSSHSLLQPFYRFSERGVGGSMRSCSGLLELPGYL